jgi:prepilin-type N-terminal cleavage/methylation domain-containing protein
MRKGFTLVEVLTTLALVGILLATVAAVFAISADTAGDGEARIEVDTQARHAMDRLQSDLLGCLSFDDGRQRFLLENGAIDGQEADAMSFRTLAAWNEAPARVEAEYRLRPSTDPKARSGRRLFTLTRSARPADGSFALVEEEAARNVTSFNIEVSTSSGFAQLDRTPPPRFSTLRVTIRVTDGAAEREERTVTREFWIPGAGR